MAACTWAVACTLNDPAVIVDVRPQQPDAAAPVVSRPPPVTDRLDAGAPLDPEPPPDERPPGGCRAGATRPCGPSTEAGNCALGTRLCVNGAWGDCTGAVHPEPRICGASEDKDCDGVSDDTPDAVCECNPGAVEPCETHPGLDGVGSCRAGQRTCEASADGRSSRWGACTGSVGPAAADSCLIRGDDSDCDATPNGGCTCIEGEVVPCGPPSELGICRKGTSTCVNAVFTACEGSVLPRARDCASEADNDCDGLPDNTIDEVCSCAVGTSEPCDTHPQDGVGICRPGTRTCVAGEDGASSRFGACTGSVGPTARRCNSSADNDCNGIADNTIDSVCACVIGSVQLCEQHPGLDDIGRCRAGQQLCVAGPNNTTAAFAACSGSVGPAAADSCAVAGDDADCDGTPNGGCECVAGNDELCAGNPAASSCNAAGRCVPCAVDADCSLVSGLPACNAGTCVRCSADTHCPTGQTCDLTTFACEAPPPPITEEPEEPTPVETPPAATPVVPVPAATAAP